MSNSALYKIRQGAGVAQLGYDKAVGWTTGLQFSERAWIFSLRHCVQTGAGVHPVSFSLGIVGSFPRVKVVAAW